VRDGGAAFGHESLWDGGARVVVNSAILGYSRPAKVVSVKEASQDAERFVLDVRVSEGRGETRHVVTLAKKDHARLARRGETAEAFVERCFGFLLAREPKESILTRFDVAVIGRYFPEFERAIG
jgi:hypothetical protein